VNTFEPQTPDELYFQAGVLLIYRRYYLPLWREWHQMVARDLQSGSIDNPLHEAAKGRSLVERVLGQSRGCGRFLQSPQNHYPVLGLTQGVTEIQGECCLLSQMLSWSNKMSQETELCKWLPERIRHCLFAPGLKGWKDLNNKKLATNATGASVMQKNQGHMVFDEKPHQVPSSPSQYKFLWIIWEFQTVHPDHPHFPIPLSSILWPLCFLTPQKSHKAQFVYSLDHGQTLSGQDLKKRNKFELCTAPAPYPSWEAISREELRLIPSGAILMSKLLLLLPFQNLGWFARRFLITVLFRVRLKGSLLHHDLWWVTTYVRGFSPVARQ